MFLITIRAAQVQEIQSGNRNDMIELGEKCVSSLVCHFFLMGETFLMPVYFPKEFKVCGQGHKKKKIKPVMGESAL